MKIRFNARGNVRCEACIPLPFPVTTAWGQLRDFHRFASQDYFHSRIDIDGGVPRAGASLSIIHRFAFFKVTRRGRIVRWCENEGFAFSDLSLRGNQFAFPHVLDLRLKPTSSTSCQLDVSVSGRWTAPIPRWMARLWLWWVFAHVTRSIGNEMLTFALFRKYWGIDGMLDRGPLATASEPID